MNEFKTKKENYVKGKFGNGFMNYEFFDGQLVILDKSKDFIQVILNKDGSGTAAKFNKWDINQLIRILKRLKREI